MKLFKLASLIVASLALGGGAAARPLKVESLDIATARGVYHFKVEIADNDETRERGLMFRRSLAADRGMLFDFKTVQPGGVSFWMKNTLIPLDILFITSDGRILTIAHAVPLSETPVPSGGPVLGVLEIAGSRATAIGAAPGDKVRERIFHK
ncbi:MAG TPA: DUF192 domain-containing protein [Caulobacteraceae bacterium]|nr:DUF192 domain-containing protein [Caulobacteraceae bacterium]